MAENQLFLEILTPERSLFSGYVKSVNFPAENGYLGILPGHALLVTRLGVGVITVAGAGGQESRFFCDGGAAEVGGQAVCLLATTAEAEAGIDAGRARQAKERAEKRLYSGQAGVDYARAMASLQRALYRLQATGRR